MRYCNRCVLPETRPGIQITSTGSCSACVGHDKKGTQIDWQAREQAFLKLVEETKKLKRPFDCIVPVSGGKDSTYQVVKCLELGLKVLAVTWKTPSRTEIGQKNLENLISLGVDHIDYSVSPEVERLFTLKALERTGSTGVPMHYGLYVIPIRAAMAFDIPLVVWGESPMMEYQGGEDEKQNLELDHHFLRSHGILQGTQIEDWVDEDLSLRDLEIFRMPEEDEFRKARLKSVFIGYYYSWSPQESLKVALEHGFQVREEGPKVGYYNFADIDCEFISIHHYFKWLKFGCTRLFDNLSLEIRNGHMTREQAIEIIAEKGEQRPVEDIEALCSFLRISPDEFWKIAERFRNLEIWKKVDGVWTLPGFLVEDWDWENPKSV